MTKFIFKLCSAILVALAIIFFSMLLLNSKSTKKLYNSQLVPTSQSKASKDLGNSSSHNDPIITASSNAFPDEDQYAPEYLLQEGRTIWHAESPLSYPQWIEISFPKPVLITHLGIRSQGDGRDGTEHRRGPKSFVFQGSNDASESANSKKSRKWRYLFNVENNVYTTGEEWKDWSFVNSTAFRFYRIYIKSGGDRNNLTIRQIRLDNAAESHKSAERLPEHVTGASALTANELLPADFDWRTYIEKYKDLQNTGIDTKEEAAKHWLKIGRKEGRTYKEPPIQVPDVPYMPWRERE